jgi:hypothetical protein
MTRSLVGPLVVAVAVAGAVLPRSVPAFDVVINAQGEFADAYLVRGSGPPSRVVFIDPDPPEPDNPHGKPPRVGRHVNGKLCFFPRGFGHDGDFVMADDTYREACVDRNPPQARCSETRRGSRFYVGKDPDGWAVFRANGRWTKEHIHTPWDFTTPPPQGNRDPQGCAFDAHGNLWGTDVGNEDFAVRDGSVVIFFPGKKNRYDTYCFLDEGLAAPGMPAMDAAGNLYVPEPSAFRVTEFSPPFPSSAADCANPDHLVTRPPTKTVFLTGKTYASIVRVPKTDHFDIASVVIPPIVNEYDHDGNLVRTIAAQGVPRNPLGLDVGSDGTVYYAELNLDPTTLDTRCGYVSRVRFDASGQPLAPETLGKDLRFPDGVTVVDSHRLHVNLAKLPPSPAVDPARCGGE